MDTTRVVLAYLRSDPVSLEAGIKDWFRGLLARIPGLPSRQEALKIGGEFLQREPAKFEGAVEEIFSILQSAGREQFNLRAALDMHSFLRGVKTVTNPKVILAIIALMGIFQTADAGALRDRIRGAAQQEQQVQQTPDWVKDFEKSNQGDSGTIQVDGKDYAVGKSLLGSSRDPNLCKTMADNRARQAGGKDLVKRYFGNDVQGNTAMFSLFSK